MGGGGKFIGMEMMPSWTTSWLAGTEE